MSDMVEKFLNAHFGWAIFAIVVVLLIGPAGLTKAIDRLFPPPQVKAVEDVGDDIQKMRRDNSRQINKLVRGQDVLIDAVRELVEDSNRSGLVLMRMDTRLATLERWRATLLPETGSPRNPPGRHVD